ncbi:serine/threonine-protein phosphatase 6 regulatory ankyrin repeat subunit B-like [Hylaeus volcanicus]|uniref:serine/threonine-protein phosphatase 6 regulatory ankyrin repeat subunit B-like n=1 Tax=Hylaeus volcanicus TaxID=313075 RepID=UPI0023B77CE3|nr:serine/threonine-protein phosphatase 6 regulatory ankyrin repeat subunit B-like [Hylaeus volcanicus]
MELVALINRLTEKQLTHIPLTLEAFEIQTNLLKALKQLDFTLVGHYTKRLALYNQIHKCNLWNQMKHLKGFQLPLHYTTGLKGDLGITLLSLFLKFGADINQRDKNFCTPLMLTSQLGRTAFTEFLLTQGARVDLVDYKGYTALHYACAEGHVETAARLLLFGANPNALGAPRLQWETPLEISVNSRVVRARDMVKTLMNYDTNTKYQIPSRFYKNETSMLMKLLQFDVGFFLY